MAVEREDARDEPLGVAALEHNLALLPLGHQLLEHLERVEHHAAEAAVVLNVDVVRAVRPHQAHVVRQLVHLLEALRQQRLALARREPPRVPAAAPPLGHELERVARAAPVSAFLMAAINAPKTSLGVAGSAASPCSAICRARGGEVGATSGAL